MEGIGVGLVLLAAPLVIGAFYAISGQPLLGLGVFVVGELIAYGILYSGLWRLLG